ncbi:MAG TPA: FmdB family zinc ribbon protein [Longimicrobium sp.]|nr:FmdB family zinc ribbon protein [Longimicrobium sp.]
MPTYEYRCPQCGNEFEKFGKMSDPPVTECTQCGAEAQRRISGGAGLVFKGSGFYITDYRGEGYKKAAQSESGGSSPSGGESRSGTGEAPAPKSESKSSGSSSSGGSSPGGASKSE